METASKIHLRFHSSYRSSFQKAEEQSKKAVGRTLPKAELSKQQSPLGRATRAWGIYVRAGARDRGAAAWSPQPGPRLQTPTTASPGAYCPPAPPGVHIARRSQTLLRLPRKQCISQSRDQNPQATLQAFPSHEGQD